MNTRVAAAAIAVTAALTLTACGVDDGSGTTENGDTTNAEKAEKAEKAENDQKTKAEDTEATTKPLPKLTGKGLQSAQDAAQAAGFYRLTSHDALGRDRMQVLDRGWKVCSQKPAPGTHSTDAKVDLGAVKTTENCPDKDVAPPAKTREGGAMPNFTGKSVKAARGALDSSASVDVEDATGQGRIVLLESNWKVCGQTPATGSSLNGQPVKLRAVKFEENCG